jgi:hypothetical protein
MKRTWYLQDELYRSFHHWPLIAIFIIAGSLIGWGSSYLWPAYSRATVEVHVGLNPYRAFSDSTFLALARPRYSNLDDFKNWQMSQLQTVIFSDDFIQATLAQLRQDNPTWNTVSTNDLRDMLSAEWRSAGRWRLTAIDQNPERAAQAAYTWANIAIPLVEQAIQQAQELFMIDYQMQVAAEEWQSLQSRASDLQIARKTLLALQKDLSLLAPQQPLEQVTRWRVLSTAAHLADFSPAWMAILETQPATDAPPAEYISWIEKVVVLIDAEVSDLLPRLPSLEQQREQLAVQYAASFKTSRGLSPNLAIEDYRKIAPRQIRAPGSSIVIGAVIGLLAWFLVQFARVAWSEKH